MLLHRYRSATECGRSQAALGDKEDLGGIGVLKGHRVLKGLEDQRLTMRRPGDEGEVVPLTCKAARTYVHCCFSSKKQPLTSDLPCACPCLLRPLSRAPQLTSPSWSAVLGQTARDHVILSAFCVKCHKASPVQEILHLGLSDAVVFSIATFLSHVINW